MKKFKRVVSVVALASLAASLTIGCGDSENNKEDSKEPTKSEQGEEKKEKDPSKKSIKMYITGYESDTFKPLYDKGIEKFEEENPDIDIDVIPAGWDEATSKLLSLIQANETPDVIISGTRELRQLSELGALEPLDEYMTDEFKSKRVENVLDTAKIDGKQYGIPLAFSSKALYYRTDLVPEPPKTWDELEATAKKVVEENPDVKGFAIGTDIDAVPDLLNFFYQNEGRITDEEGNVKLNTEANIETMDFLKKLNDEGLMPNPVDTKRTNISDLFANKKLAMFVSGPWEKDKIGNEANDPDAEIPYNVTTLPKGKVMAETLVTDSYAISALSEDKETAWKLIETMGDFEVQNNYNEAMGFFPILKEEEKEDRYESDFLKPFAEMIQYGVPEPHMPISADFQKGIMDAVKKVMMGEASSKEALDKLQEDLSK
ncbi:MAG: sugar ABC transporter substrate-binding protein [Andreesenia angusta]|nr:sugar ABC transporter substrate-binding protein [Andreesenia angusta]